MNALEAYTKTIEVRSNLSILLKDVVEQLIQKNLEKMEKQISKGFSSMYLEYFYNFDSDHIPEELKPFVYIRAYKVATLNEPCTKLVRMALSEYFTKQGFSVTYSRRDGDTDEHGGSVLVKWG